MDGDPELEGRPQAATHGKTGIIASLVGTLGLGGSIGLTKVLRKSSRAIDELVFAGRSVGKGKALRRAERLRAGVLAGESVQSEKLARARELADLADLGQTALDGYELLRPEVEVEAPVAAAEGREAAHSPQFINLDDDGWMWAKFLAGEINAVRPWFFVAEAEGEALLINGEAVDLDTLVRACWEQDTTCVFVGCQGHCAKLTAWSYDAIGNPKPHESADAYLLRFVERRLEDKREPGPSFLAVARSSHEPRFELIQPKPEG